MAADSEAITVSGVRHRLDDRGVETTAWIGEAGGVHSQPAAQLPARNGGLFEHTFFTLIG